MTSPRIDHDSAKAARHAVAVRLAGVLITAGVTPDVVDDLGDEVWAQAVDAAKILDPSWHTARNYIPSNKTRKVTATIVRYRLQAVSAADPFAGLNGVDD